MMAQPLVLVRVDLIFRFVAQSHRVPRNLNVEQITACMLEVRLLRQHPLPREYVYRNPNR